VTNERGSLQDQLTKVLKSAVAQYKKGKKKYLVVTTAVAKATRIIDKSYEELVAIALRHSKSRTKKDVGVLSPEQTKRLMIYKQDTLGDFKKILTDQLEGVKKK